MNLKRLFQTRGPAARVLIRLMVGSVFLSEGNQKFLFPATLGVGRFAKIGFAHPDLLAPFVPADVNAIHEFMAFQRQEHVAAPQFLERRDQRP